MEFKISQFSSKVHVLNSTIPAHIKMHAWSEPGLGTAGKLNMEKIPKYIKLDIWLIIAQLWLNSKSTSNSVETFAHLEFKKMYSA